jgi:hypothetical protein
MEQKYAILTVLPRRGNSNDCFDENETNKK